MAVKVSSYPLFRFMESRGYGKVKGPLYRECVGGSGRFNGAAKRQSKATHLQNMCRDCAVVQRFSAGGGHAGAQLFMLVSYGHCYLRRETKV